MADEIPDAIDEVIDDESEDEEDELIRLRHLLARSRQEHTEQNEKLREFKVTVDKLSAEIKRKRCVVECVEKGAKERGGGDDYCGETEGRICS